MFFDRKSKHWVLENTTGCRRYTFREGRLLYACLCKKTHFLMLILDSEEPTKVNWVTRPELQLEAVMKSQPKTCQNPAFFSTRILKIAMTLLKRPLSSILSPEEATLHQLRLHFRVQAAHTRYSMSHCPQMHVQIAWPRKPRKTWKSILPSGGGRVNVFLPAYLLTYMRVFTFVVVIR